MRWLYCNPDDQDRATELGCGWFPDVPAEYVNIATAPCVILAGAGQQIVLPDDGTLAYADVEAAAQPIVDAEATPTPAPTTVAVQVDPAALADAQTAISQATTVKGLREAVTAALGLLVGSPGQ